MGAEGSPGTAARWGHQHAEAARSRPKVAVHTVAGPRLRPTAFEADQKGAG